MKLYGFPPSPNTWKVRAVAAHLGIPLEMELVDLTKVENFVFNAVVVFKTTFGYSSLNGHLTTFV